MAKLMKGAVTIKLKYKAGWTPAQKAAADMKVSALNEADLVVTHNATRASNMRGRFQKAGGTLKKNEDLDHIVDLQLGGKDAFSNMKGLDFSVNRSLGPQIQNQIKHLPDATRVKKVIIGDPIAKKKR